VKPSIISWTAAIASLLQVLASALLIVFHLDQSTCPHFRFDPVRRSGRSGPSVASPIFSFAANLANRRVT